jgi:hypothetical protein
VTDARGGQLDRQRQPVKPKAELCHDGCIPITEREVRADRARPLDEQQGRVCRAEWGHRKLVLAVQVKGLAARREHLQARAHGQ